MAKTQKGEPEPAPVQSTEVLSGLEAVAKTERVICPDAVTREPAVAEGLALAGVRAASLADAATAGAAGDVTIDTSGGSQADLSDLVAANADVEASGGSQVTVNVTGRLDADASAGSKVYYLGNPTLGRIDESSGAEVRRK